MQVIREQQYRTYFNREEEVLAAKPQLRKEALQVDSVRGGAIPAISARRPLAPRGLL